MKTIVETIQSVLEAIDQPWTRPFAYMILAGLLFILWVYI